VLRLYFPLRARDEGVSQSGVDEPKPHLDIVDDTTAIERNISLPYPTLSRCTVLELVTTLFKS
jgi:hypothetical protein